MANTPVTRETVFGYLSAWDSPDHGCLGGYLILSALGRPLEFHCTTPVRTSRAQQILFGPTLWPYVLGEQIGGTLLGEAKLRPSMILADHSAMLCLRAQAGVPVAWLIEAGRGEQGARSETQNILTVADCAFELPADYEADQA